MEDPLLCSEDPVQKKNNISDDLGLKEFSLGINEILSAHQLDKTSSTFLSLPAPTVLFIASLEVPR